MDFHVYSRRSSQRSGHRTTYDESFVLTALFSAIEEDNLVGVEELMTMSKVDVNLANRNGHTAVHIAAGLGHLEILRFLHSKGAELECLDTHGDNAITWAAREGHIQVIKYLLEQGVVVDTQNKAGQTALHVAALYNRGETILLLCKYGWNTNAQNKEGETPLHCAALRGNLEAARCLLSAGAQIDLVDKNGSTPLHLSLQSYEEQVSMFLLQSSSQIDMVDKHKEAPIHICAREGLLTLAQTLCAFGCKVDAANKAGLYPLHLAAKNGHIEIVRCLCLAGCTVDQKNGDGIVAEITALAQGYRNIGDLLNRLRNDQLREEFISQLIPSTQPISRIKLKLFGHSGAGKSTLTDSLKCGYFSSWFRRSRAPSPTSLNTRIRNGNGSSKSSIELNVPGSDDIPLMFETNLDSYTRGIDIQQISVSGAGDFSVWEFSGHQPYYMLYDHFIGNTNCLHAVVFSMSDPYKLQLQQITFWLSFLQACIPPEEPLRYCGKSNSPAKVVLIATHADVAGCYRHATTGEYVSGEISALLQEVQRTFQNIFDLHDTVFITDAHVAGSPGIRNLKQYLNTERTKIVQDVPKSTGFLEAMVTHLQSWRKSTCSNPVLLWQHFIDMVHMQVNPLAGIEHMKEIIQQLQLMGEVLFLKSSPYNEDMVVLNPRCLCVDFIGHLLSQEHLEQARVTGLYTTDDFQLLFPETHALDLLQVAQALNICTRCDSEDDVEFEFPCFNLIETLEGLWEKGDKRYVYGGYAGIKIQAPSELPCILACLFPRLQVQMRRSANEHPDPENDLYQWHHGFKFCSGCLEGLVTLSDHRKTIEIKVRGPNSRRTDCFYFLEDLVSVVDQMLIDTCPGLLVSKHLLSSSELRLHSLQPTSYPPDKVILALLKDGTSAVVLGHSHKEEVLDLVFFGASDLIAQCLTPRSESSVDVGVILGPDLHVSHLSLLSRQKLCSVLDPPESMGRDWCMLGVLLGMSEHLPDIDPGTYPSFSPTGRTLEEWSKHPSSTIGNLLSKLEELGREDAIQVILQSAPLLKVFPSPDEIPDNLDVAGTASHSSGSNVS
ncbi:death-associated protein kinase 1-like isoform X2 [Tachypleus tridentatus]|uniref:death-associated protein kinase 1-like isoform X2 n=1 Tax=Tachypleus tridentatus TaxID=6853 RepID=UPI003FD0821A